MLHTRISEDLEDDLRRAAEELRVPVSNLVRNVLEEAMTVVEAVSDEFGELIDDVVDSAEEVAERFQRSPRGQRWTEAARAARARAERRAEPAEPAAPVPPAPPTPPAPGATAAILGWQPLVLNEEQRCACGRTLARGESAHVALTTAGISQQYRCAECVAGLRSS